MKNVRSVSGFTLVELLVVMGILALTLSLLLPVMSAARDKSRRVACKGHLQKIFNAVTIYAQDHDGFSPPTLAPTEDRRASPYIERDNVVQKWGLLYPHYLGEKKSFFCPSRRNGTPGSARGIDDFGVDFGADAVVSGYSQLTGFGPDDLVNMERQDDSLSRKVYAMDFFEGEGTGSAPAAHRGNYYNLLRFDGSVMGFEDEEEHLVSLEDDGEVLDDALTYVEHHMRINIMDARTPPAVVSGMPPETPEDDFGSGSDE